MTSPASWSGSDLAYVDSSLATKSMRGRLTGESVHSRSSLRLKKTTRRSRPKHSPWKKRLPCPWVGLTAWQALIERAKLKQGKKVLIHAGAGGVGTFAIQLAKHVGATVATTTSPANVDLVRSLGADIVIDSKKEDFGDVLRDYDVVLNSLDKVTLEKSLRVLKPGGQLISISGPPDAAFARNIGASWVVRMIVGVLSYRIRAKEKRRRANYLFLL
jgi:NADPH:quinone reductase-like Zn-dependent oxidoreductase